MVLGSRGSDQLRSTKKKKSEIPTWGRNAIATIPHEIYLKTTRVTNVRYSV